MNQNEIAPKNWLSPCCRFQINKSSIGYRLYDIESGCQLEWRHFKFADYDSELVTFEAAKAFAMMHIN